GAMGTSAHRASDSIYTLSGRVRILARLATSLGPALVPMSAVATQGIAGLANQFGMAAIAAGVSVAAFQGVGDALTAMNDAALEPTAENLAAAREAMESISPAAREFVRQFQDL